MTDHHLRSRLSFQRRNSIIQDLSVLYRTRSLTYQNAKIPASLRLSFLKRTTKIQDLKTSSFKNIISRNSPISSTKCPLCEQNHQRSEMESVGDCQHYFCHQCMQKYCVYKISVMEVITCPEEGCLQKLEEQAELFQKLDGETKRKYLKLLNWKKTIDNPNLKLCPSENCEGIINTQQGNYRCQKCKVTFCKECQLPQHEGACDSNFQLNFKDWKRCPKCHMFIEKQIGCNHIVCLCKHQFCYICLSNWESIHYHCVVSKPPSILGYEVQKMSATYKRIVLVLLVLVFPIFLVLGLALSMIAVVLATVIMIFYTPVVARKEFPSCHIVVYVILSPLVMVIGGFCGVFVIVYQVGLGLMVKIREYVEILRALAKKYGKVGEEEFQL